MCGDYLSFSAVSTVWRSISQGINSRSPYKLPRYHFLPKKNSIPMLLQPGGEEGGDMHYLYSTTEQKIYSGLDIPELNNKWIPGSANGWLVTIDISDLQMNLLNPLTRVRISLPASSTFQKPYCPLFHDGSNLNFVKRVHISSNPVDDNKNCLCVAMVSCKRTLSLCKIGDYNWKKLEPSIFGINDVIMYKDLLYAMNWEGKLFAIEVGPITKVAVIAKLEISRGRPQYLVKSSRNLLLVVRIRESIGPYHIKTIDFKVYKLVETQSTDTDSHEHFKTEDGAIHYQDEPIHCAWEEIETLDDANYEHDLSRLRGIFNCPRDIGSYDMESRKIELLPGLSESSSWMPSIWLSPNF
ncbi:hypothetical protein LUZ60_000351 [Juncus effusus]|nr:hypothetical protein LUZ60_000351 [Juncus effusus]